MQIENEPIDQNSNKLLIDDSTFQNAFSLLTGFCLSDLELDFFKNKNSLISILQELPETSLNKSIHSSISILKEKDAYNEYKDNFIIGNFNILLPKKTKNYKTAENDFMSPTLNAYSSRNKNILIYSDKQFAEYLKLNKEKEGGKLKNEIIIYSEPKEKDHHVIEKKRKRPKSETYCLSTCKYSRECGNQTMIECSGKDCQKKWFHISCLNFNEKEYQKYVQRTEQKWYCRDCTKKLN
jgi:hypothetical protein